MLKLSEIMDLLEVSETDAINAILNLVSPPPPLQLNKTGIDKLPLEMQHQRLRIYGGKLIDADFRCNKCSSQMRLSFNHKNGDATDHHVDNLEVICFSCNRAASKKGTRDINQHFKLATSAIELWKSSNNFPFLEEIRKKANVEQIGGATYLLKYIEKRLLDKKI